MSTEIPNISFNPLRMDICDMKMPLKKLLSSTCMQFPNSIKKKANV